MTLVLLVTIRPLELVIVTVKLYVPAAVNVAVVFFEAFVPLGLKLTARRRARGRPGVREGRFALVVSAEDGECRRCSGNRARHGGSGRGDRRRRVGHSYRRRADDAADRCSDRPAAVGGLGGGAIRSLSMEPTELVQENVGCGDIATPNWS